MKNNDVNIKITLNTHMAIEHLMSASILALEAAEIENNYKNVRNILSKEYVNKKMKYNACVVSSIFMTTSFLEAQINELFSDAANGKIVSGNDSVLLKIESLSESWKNGIPRTGKYSIFDKYSTALQIANDEKMNKGVLPNQDVLLLIKLRNALIHYESEEVSTCIKNNTKYSSNQTLESILRNKYRLNPFVAIGNPFFPDKCISFGCACWGIIRAMEFTTIFFEKLDMMFYIEKLIVILNEYIIKLEEEKCFEKYSYQLFK